MSTAVYDLVTAKILDALSQGVVPWRRPWTQLVSLPQNGITKRPYRGINLLLLSLAPHRDCRWLTFRQVTSLGGSVRKGEKATMIVFWRHWEIPDKESDHSKPLTIPLLRYYSVFNAEQAEGLPPSPVEPTDLRPAERNERLEVLIRDMPNPPRIQEGIGAWYRPSDDLVSVPALKTFCSTDAYYSTLLHELGHSTGHESRLNRKAVTGTVRFGSDDYSFEELVAELSSAFLCAEHSLDNSIIENSASYIHGWLSVFEGNPKMIVMAAAKAQHAADYIRGASQQVLEAVA
jgi:antirestriction protein ArdC